MINNKFKSCLAKIKVAQSNKKKILKIKLSMVEVTLLDILWQKGFIHGYSIFDKYCHIFLKYNLAGYGLLESVVLVNYNLSNKELRNSFHLNYYCGYITMSSKKKIHYYSGNRFLNLNESSFSGELIAKI